MAKDAIKAKREVDGGRRFRQGRPEVRDIEGEVHAWKAGKIRSLEARPVDLRFGNVKAARSNCRKPEFAGSDDETAQPGAGTAARVEEADGRGARGPQARKLSIQDSPNVPVGISVQPVEYKQVFRITIRIRSVFIASFIVDRGYVLALITLSGLTGL